MRLGKIGTRRLCRELPYEAELAYLESTGTQWIDTGILPNQTMQVEGRFKRNNSDYAYVFGCGGGWTSVGSNSCSVLLFPSSGIQGHIGNASVTAGVNPAQSVFDFRLSLTYGFEVKYQWSTAWTSVSYSTESQSQVFSGTLPVALFANMSGQSTTIRNLAGRIYFIQIWKDGILVRDFHPVRFTNEQGKTEGAMYDRVSGELFRNRGTGAFVIDPDITAQKSGGGG